MLRFENVPVTTDLGADGGNFLRRRETARTPGAWRHGAQAAFTLVELLVVISIISVLAALLLPALERSIQTAREVSCSNNTRQYSIACTNYADEWDGILPWSTAGFHNESVITRMVIAGVLQRGGRMRCPSNACDLVGGLGNKGYYSSNYAYNISRLGDYNRSISGSYKDLIRKISTIRKPEQCPSFFDSPFYNEGGGALAGFICAGGGTTAHNDISRDRMFEAMDWSLEGYGQKYSTWNYHQGRVVFVYLDGHSRSWRQEEIAAGADIFEHISGIWNSYDHSQDVFGYWIDGVSYAPHQDP